MDRLQYLMKRYKTNDLEILDCRVPFDYKDKRYEKLTDKQYISMIDAIEEIEDNDIYKMLKERGVI